MVAWIILLAPISACFIITLLTKKYKKLSAWIAICALLLSFALSLFIFIKGLGQSESTHYEYALSWISIWDLHLQIGLAMDPLSILMCLVVTGVGSAIFIYSYSYMEEDPGFSRYFASLSLFAFSMLGIVLSNNFIQIFIFWELVGASSYLLIGFWYEKDSAADAGNKAFLVNRVGDFGFLIGILMLWVLSGTGIDGRSFHFQTLSESIPALAKTGIINPNVFALIGLLIFCGVLGKSAQFPLHVWLPDAMEGPTPVSALIHAATMVAAGVYLLARVFFIFATSATAMAVIACIGAFTSIFAASIAIVQNDIKRILAYSTLSQLGYMVMAIGLGGTTEGMYHLTTHAFFKALLFLGAGSIIHALHTQDIWEMGGLLKKMPVTCITFLIGTLALCGIAPLSGFWSKDAILAIALEKNFALFSIALITAGFTAIYMGRLCFVAILGPELKANHAHEAPLSMKGPLIFL
ncbi:MAG: NADH-quinone oxidoreductase subunit L, partial [Chlamydiota bacterium]|nr:NADH-quinone oxidoreductase subunit L [Chlamydiota bacterium]